VSGFPDVISGDTDAKFTCAYEGACFGLTNFNWEIFPDPGNTEPRQGQPLRSGHRISLLNRTAYKYLVYDERILAINLAWGFHCQFCPGTPKNFEIVKRRDSNATLLFGEDFALKERTGGYLRYGYRTFGVNLDWSSIPVYEWRFTGEREQSGEPVLAGAMVHLYSRSALSAGAYLRYGSAVWGINLDWWLECC
jgi:hypothetical protein